MSRSNLTVSIDTEIKIRAMELINRNEKRGFASELVENCLKYYIDKREDTNNEFIEEKEKGREIF